MGNQLGGKKAAMQFVHESIYGKLKLVNVSLGDGESKGDERAGEKENSFDDLWKLSEDLNTLEAALESLQGKEITSENTREVHVEEVKDAENEEKEFERKSQSEKIRDLKGALDEFESNAGEKEQLNLRTETKLENTEVEKESRSPSIAESAFKESSPTGKDDADKKGFLPRSQLRLTKKGMRGRRKALAGLRDEI